MDYLMKWNCYDLADQLNTIERCAREFDGLYDETRQLLGKIDAEASLAGAVLLLREQLPHIREASHRLNAESAALDRCIDVYYATETRVKERVAASLQAENNQNSPELFVESWLEELI
jgi:uncharacterized protein YigA (DUF484 family)